MAKINIKCNLLISLGLIIAVPASVQAACTLTSGQVLINEFMPNPTTGNEWVELYNTTTSNLNVGECYLDDVAGTGGNPKAINTNTVIPAQGVMTFDLGTSYLNNDGDDMRLLADAAGTTVLDSYTYTISTKKDESFYRWTDGGEWVGWINADSEWVPTPTYVPSKGLSNTYDVDTCKSGTWVPGKLEIHQIDMGQGAAALIVGPTGKTMMMDVGETYYSAYSAAKIESEYVYKILGCRKVDYVMMSHFHVDHIGYVGNGGLWGFVNRGRFRVGQTLLRDYEEALGDHSSTFIGWKGYFESTQGKALMNPLIIKAGDVFSLGSGDAGEAIVEIIASNGAGSLIPYVYETTPGGSDDDDGSSGSSCTDVEFLCPPGENNYSVAAVLQYGQFSYYSAGDMEGEFEESEYSSSRHDIETTIAKKVGHVEAMLASHHGSKHSNNQTIIDTLSPKVSLISAGNGNTYGHPASETVARLVAASDVYATEQGALASDDPNYNAVNIIGTILVTTADGKNYNVENKDRTILASYVAGQPTVVDADGDGYPAVNILGAVLDPNDNNKNVIPAYNGGCDNAQFYNWQYCQEPPVNVVATSTARGNATISWTPASHVNSYNLYEGRSTSGTFIKVKSGISDESATVTLTKQLSGRTMYFKITGVVDGRESSFSNVASVTIK